MDIAIPGGEFVVLSSLMIILNYFLSTDPGTFLVHILYGSENENFGSDHVKTIEKRKPLRKNVPTEFQHGRR